MNPGMLFQILSGDTGAILRPVKHYKHGSVAIMCIRFHPMKHNEFLVGTANGIIRRCEATTGASQSVATGTVRLYQVTGFNKDS